MATFMLQAYAAPSVLFPRQLNSSTQSTCSENQAKHPTTPTDIIKDIPRCSSDRRSCYSYVADARLQSVDGSYRVLDGAYYPTVAVGPWGADANSYTAAYATCSSICNAAGKACQSFNLLTISEIQVGDCRPTWACRYSNKAFDVSEYSQHGAAYSVVYNVYARCDYGAQNCALWGFRRTWAQCSALEKDGMFRAQMVIAAQLDGENLGSEIDNRVLTQCLFPGASDWYATIKYPFMADWQRTIGIAD